METTSIYLIILLAVGGLVFLILFFHYVPFFLWLSAKVSGVNISLVQLFLMRIRKVPPYVIVPGLIEAHKAGLSNITRDELEAHYLAGGHVEKLFMLWFLHRKPVLNFPFRWPPLLTWQDVMCLKPYRCLLIPRLLIRHP